MLVSVLVFLLYAFFRLVHVEHAYPLPCLVSPLPIVSVLYRFGTVWTGVISLCSFYQIFLESNICLHIRT